jgi:protein-tyrosine phosphatase
MRAVLPWRRRVAAHRAEVVDVPTDGTRLGVLFVCMGNICRSPIAEGVFRHKLGAAGLDGIVRVDSAGTHGYHSGEPPDRRAQAHAAVRAYDLSSLRARQVTKADFERFDYVLAMDESNLKVLEELRPPGFSGHLGLLLDFTPGAGYREVPDPYYGGPAGFELVLDLIEPAADALVETIRRRLG